MTDEADIANDAAQKALDNTLSSRVIYQGESADECIECGELIPSERQIAVPGCQLCIDCAARYEKRGRTVRCR